MLEVNTTDPPVQKDVAGAVMFAVGNAAASICVTAEVFLHPELFVTSTVYEPGVEAA